jgi:hypothetical protein
MNKNLSNFLVDIASNPDQLDAFFADPYGVLDESTLTAEEKLAVLSGDGSEVRRLLARRPGDIDPPTAVVRAKHPGDIDPPVAVMRGKRPDDIDPPVAVMRRKRPDDIDPPVAVMRRKRPDDIDPPVAVIR